MTPLRSVAMIEKFALLRIALCKALVPIKIISLEREAPLSRARASRVGAVSHRDPARR
jgi:hypothetical protein